MQSFLSPLIALLICLYLVKTGSFFNIQGVSRSFVFLLFSCKALAGLAVAHFTYPLLNGNDGYFYFEAGKVFQQYGIAHPYNYAKLFLGFRTAETSVAYYNLLNWKNLMPFNDGETMIRLNSLLHFLSFNNYHTHTILFGFFSFCGLTGMYKSLAHISKYHSKLLLTIFILFPSLLIFSSGDLKESVLMGTSGLFGYFFFMRRKNKARNILCLFFGISLFFIKPHFVFFLIPVLASCMICFRFIKRKFLYPLIFAGITGIYFISIACLIGTVNGESIPFVIGLTQQSSMKNSVFFKANSYTRPPIIANSYHSLIKNSPAAFLHAVSHPSFKPWKRIQVNLAAVENLCVLVLLLINIAACFIPYNTFYHYHLSIVMFTVLFYTLIGYTQALEATILRFKAPIVPLLISGVYLLLIHFRNHKALLITPLQK